MADIIVRQMPAFKRAYKKLHSFEQSKVADAIRAIIRQPELGEEKRGDLANVFIYKFKIHQQEMLLAYEWNEKERILLMLGVHENFHRDLKRRH